MAFDLGSFDEASDLEKPALSWRLVPDVSLSDWVIKVETEGADPLQYQEYHCHRSYLGVGPRSCTYFARLFASPNSFTEGKTSTSTLLLKANAAQAMPAFLDFVYSSDADLDICTESSISLLELSNYLGCRACFTEVQGFIQGDLSVKTSPLYIREASVFAADKVLSAAIKVCAASFEEVPEEFLMELEPHLFEAVVEDDSFACSSDLFSMRVAKYLKRHEDECTGDLVANLTRSEKMSSVDSQALLDLLSFSVAFQAVDQVGVESEAKMQAAAEECPTKDDTNLAFAAESVRSLRQRCSPAGFREWHSSPTEIAALPQDVAIDLLQDGLGAAISELGHKKKEMAVRLAAKQQEISSWQKKCTETESLLARFNRIVVVATLETHDKPDCGPGAEKIKDATTPGCTVGRVLRTTKQPIKCPVFYFH